MRRQGLDSGGEGWSIFYLEVTGGAVLILIRKTEVEETQFQFTYRSQFPHSRARVLRDQIY